MKFVFSLLNDSQNYYFHLYHLDKQIKCSKINVENIL